jgi:preprotein translocase subunit SecD
VRRWLAVLISAAGSVCGVWADSVVRAPPSMAERWSDRDATRTPRLSFRPLLAELPQSATTPDTPGDAAARVAIQSCDPATLLQMFPDPTKIPTTSPKDDKPGACVALRARNGELASLRYFLGPAALTSKDMLGAKLAFIQGEGWVVELRLKRLGSKKINQLAADLFAKPAPQNEMAVVLDAHVVSLPRFESADFGNGPVEISGSFTRDEASDLAKALNRRR